LDDQDGAKVGVKEAVGITHLAEGGILGNVEPQCDKAVESLGSPIKHVDEEKHTNTAEAKGIAAVRKVARGEREERGTLVGTLSVGHCWVLANASPRTET